MFDDIDRAYLNLHTEGPAVSYEAGPHRYSDRQTGEHLPNITAMLERTGWIRPEFFDEDSAERGTEVHRLTAAYDLGALDVDRCVTPYRGWLLSHVAAMRLLRPVVLEVEQIKAHPVFRYAGRLDRVLTLYGLRSVLDGKSGEPKPADRIQTALQAILDSVDARIPAQSIARFGLYWKASGKFVLEQHRDRADFDEALRIIRKCCRVEIPAAPRGKIWPKSSRDAGQSHNSNNLRR